MVLARATAPHIARQGIMEERKKVLRICVNKLQTIQDPESFLCRSVLINNTLKQIQEEHREGQRRARLKRMRQVIEEEEEDHHHTNAGDKEPSDEPEFKTKRYCPENKQSSCQSQRNKKTKLEKDCDMSTSYSDTEDTWKRERTDLEVCVVKEDENVSEEVPTVTKAVLGSIKISVVNSTAERCDDMEERLSVMGATVHQRTHHQFSSDETSSSSDEDEEDDEENDEIPYPCDEDPYPCPHMSILARTPNCEASSASSRIEVTD